MKKYILQDTEAGNVINEFIYLTDAENSLKEFEETDKLNGEYTPDFYEIKEVREPATLLTENQKISLQQFIFANLLMADEIGLGEVNECRDTAQFIVEEWANDNNITFID